MRQGVTVAAIAIGIVVAFLLFGVQQNLRRTAEQRASYEQLRDLGDDDNIRAPDYIRARPTAAPSVRSRRLAPTQVPLQSSGVSLANFNRIRHGMSYREVVEILGSDGELVASSAIAGTTTNMFEWETNAPSYGNMNVMFQNGKLVSKAQAGLE